MLDAAVAAAHLSLSSFFVHVLFITEWNFRMRSSKKKLHFIGDWVLADSRNMSPLRLYLAASPTTTATTTTTNNRIFPERASDDDDNNYNYYFHFVFEVSNAICLASAPMWCFFRDLSIFMKNAKYFTFEFFPASVFWLRETNTLRSFSAQWKRARVLLDEWPLNGYCAMHEAEYINFRLIDIEWRRIWHEISQLTGIASRSADTRRMLHTCEVNIACEFGVNCFYFWLVECFFFSARARFGRNETNRKCQSNPQHAIY